MQVVWVLPQNTLDKAMSTLFPFAPGDLLSQHWGQKARGRTDTQSTKLRAATGFYLAPERQDKEELEERAAELRGAEGQLCGICQPRFSTEALQPQACTWSSGTAKGRSGGLPRTRASVGRWQEGCGHTSQPKPLSSPGQRHAWALCMLAGSVVPLESKKLKHFWVPGHQD